jgi:membrane-bound serine protease (ClpP class)
MKKLFILLILACLTHTVSAQQTKVMVMDMKGDIDGLMRRHVSLALDHARQTNADVVIIEMDTYGGLLNEAQEIVDDIMTFKKPVWVFINSDAASAGALIAIACDSIYMVPHGKIGAATAVNEYGEKAIEKVQSYTRDIMRAAAEKSKRDPRIAEGMVDEDSEIEGIKKKGQIISFTTTEAMKHGYCEGKVASVEEILKTNNMKDYEIDRYEPSFTEGIVSFFLNPFISGILISLIIAGIYFEMQAPGLGFAGLVSLVALVLYLVPYYLNGLAENWEVLTLVIGIGLIGAEIFIIPGFGVAGISGITLTVLSLVLIMVDNHAFDFEGVSTHNLLLATMAAVGGLFGGIALLFFGGARLTRTTAFKNFTLTETQKSEEGFTVSVYKERMIGKDGIAHTVLRPSGRVLIDNQIFDAFTRGEYVEKGSRIEVVSQEGSTLLVKPVS